MTAGKCFIVGSRGFVGRAVVAALQEVPDLIAASQDLRILPR